MLVDEDANACALCQPASDTHGPRVPRASVFRLCQVLETHEQVVLNVEKGPLASVELALKLLALGALPCVLVEARGFLPGQLHEHFLRA